MTRRLHGLQLQVGKPKLISAGRTQLEGRALLILRAMLTRHGDLIEHQAFQPRPKGGGNNEHGALRVLEDLIAHLRCRDPHLHPVLTLRRQPQGLPGRRRAGVAQQP